MPAAAALIVLALAACLLGGGLALCGGHFVYTADDPYISLALADRIRNGAYGLQPGEPAAPASSILFPVLLAGLGAVGCGVHGPLVADLAAAALAAWLIARLARRHGIVTDGAPRLPVLFLLVLLAVSLNLLALAFVGLENPLHILTSLAVLAGAARCVEERRVPRWLPALIVLLPLWRFEGLALAGLACLALGALGRWRTGLATAAAIAGLLGLYGLLMARLGLPLLPSSVLVKLTQDGGAVLDPLRRLRLALASPDGLEMALMLGLVGLGAWRARRAPERSRDLMVAFLAGGTLLAQLLFGAASVFWRYSAYALATGAVGLLILWRVPLGRFMAGLTPRRFAAAGLLLTLLGFVPVAATLLVPWAARGIYEEQYQMRRFAVDDYRAPVAANDIGLVGYRNPSYVLDLWGVSAEATRLARLAGGTGWMDRLAAAHGVGVAMIYESWFRGMIPPGWIRLAVLRHSHGTVTNGGDEVAFFATSPAAVGPAVAALRRFQAGLGGVATLELLVPDSPP